MPRTAKTYKFKKIKSKRQIFELNSKLPNFTRFIGNKYYTI